MQALVDELELRGIRPADHVALISEWDTIYGRNMPKTFARSAVGKIANENIHRFTYMRGIDGQISKANEGEKAPEAIFTRQQERESDGGYRETRGQ